VCGNDAIRPGCDVKDGTALKSEIRNPTGRALPRVGGFPASRQIRFSVIGFPSDFGSRLSDLVGCGRTAKKQSGGRWRARRPIYGSVIVLRNIDHLQR